MRNLPAFPPDIPPSTPLSGENVHERPEVKPLVEKAGAERNSRVPQGTMKTGGDVAGGGGTKSLEHPEEITATPAPNAETDKG